MLKLYISEALLKPVKWKLVNIVKTWVHDDIWQPKVKLIHWSLSKITQIQYFQTSLPQNNTRLLKPNFIWSLHGTLGMKMCLTVPGHMIKVASMRIYWKKKNFKSFLLRNQEAGDLETWYTASGTHELLNWFKWWPWVHLDHFYDSQICFLMLLHGRNLIQHIAMYSNRVLIQHIRSTQVSDTGPLVSHSSVTFHHTDLSFKSSTKNISVSFREPDGHKRSVR